MLASANSSSTLPSDSQPTLEESSSPDIFDPDLYRSPKKYFEACAAELRKDGLKITRVKPAFPIIDYDDYYFKLWKIALQQNGLALKHLQQNSSALNHLKPSWFSVEEYLELCKIAIRQNWQALKFVDMYYYRNNYQGEKFFNLVDLALKYNVAALQYAPRRRDYYLHYCIEAIEFAKKATNDEEKVVLKYINWKCFLSCKDRFIDGKFDVICDSVRLSPMNLPYVHKAFHYRISEIYDSAFEGSAKALKYIPKEKHTSLMICKAINRFPRAIEHANMDLIRQLTVDIVVGQDKTILLVVEEWGIPKKFLLKYQEQIEQMKRMA